MFHPEKKAVFTATGKENQIVLNGTYQHRRRTTRKKLKRQKRNGLD